MKESLQRLVGRSAPKNSIELHSLLLEMPTKILPYIALESANLVFLKFEEISDGEMDPLDLKNALDGILKCDHGKIPADELKELAEISYRSTSHSSFPAGSWKRCIGFAVSHATFAMYFSKRQTMKQNRPQKVFSATRDCCSAAMTAGNVMWTKQSSSWSEAWWGKCKPLLLKGN